MNRRTALMIGLAAAAIAPAMPSIDYEGVVTGPRPKHVAYSALPTGARVPPPSQAKRRKRARRS